MLKTVILLMLLLSFYSCKQQAVIDEAESSASSSREQSLESIKTVCCYGLNSIKETSIDSPLEIDTHRVSCAIVGGEFEKKICDLVDVHEDNYCKVGEKHSLYYLDSYDIDAAESGCGEISMTVGDGSWEAIPASE